MVLAAADELDRLDLDDALAICGVVARREPAEFDRYAVRWLAVAIRERREIDLAFVITAVGVLERLRRDGDVSAATDALEQQTRLRRAS